MRSRLTTLVACVGLVTGCQAAVIPLPAAPTATPLVVEPTPAPPTLAPPTPTQPTPTTGGPRRQGAEPAPHVSAPHVAVLDEASGALLYEQDAFSRQPPASITKIATTIVALERGADIKTVYTTTVSSTQLVA